MLEMGVVVVVVQDCIFDRLSGEGDSAVKLKAIGEIDSIDVAEDIGEVGNEIV